MLAVPIALGNRIKQIRESSNISQSELAERLKYLNQSQISKIENGRRKITAEDLVEIARALSVSINNLISISGERGKQA